ncbi:L-asparagine oxygenase [Roseibium hamelinense]|uniref:L-asparagine oxygenase n=1 Tax=Roseibium hamelinense TaxID=150831 RepID=A0A562THK6_9HYPH|nr:TauD/TfdA family dioxygenase [Roseibium hamelinense]MTI46149.1 oxygenase [Roseibium hamelinense]TWI92658.1 L-asparagine oxygenase [Roseibium hamelinense]
MNTVFRSHEAPFQVPRTELGRLILDDETRDAMYRDLQGLTDPFKDPRSFAAQVRRSLSTIGTGALMQIHDFATAPDSPAVMLIDNLPTDRDLPPTPLDDPSALTGRAFVGEAMTYGLGKLIGEPIGYTTEKDGDILHNLIPAQGAEMTQSNRGSKTFLNFHNDCVYDESGWFHTYNADFLVLYGHRPDKFGEAETMYIDAKTLCALLDDSDIAELRKPQFELAAPSNFTMLLNNGEKIWSRLGAIISGPEDFPEISVAANGTRGTNKRASAALERLLAFCGRPEHHVSVRIGSGQALLINNRKGMHARSNFTPTFGPEERWLLRANVRRDTWPMRHRKTDRWNVYA